MPGGCTLSQAESSTLNPARIRAGDPLRRSEKCRQRSRQTAPKAGMRARNVWGFNLTFLITSAAPILKWYETEMEMEFRRRGGPDKKQEYDACKPLQASLESVTFLTSWISSICRFPWAHARLGSCMPCTCSGHVQETRDGPQLIRSVAPAITQWHGTGSGCPYTKSNLPATHNMAWVHL